MATVKSYGATTEVTGSCHVLHVNGKKIMIDCGMFQGEYEDQNSEPFAFHPKEIDALLITHGHLDHVGRIPKLVKEGFRGKIYATEATMELAQIILLDSAKIMNEDYQTKYRKAVRRATEKKVQKPIYEPMDVYNTFENMEWINVDYDTYHTIFEGITVRFKNAGHILGSAFIEITYHEHAKSNIVVFSGDIGNDNKIILPKLKKCAKADALYVETTYGNREHQALSLTIEEFKKTIQKTLNKDGNVLIPSFAVERTQELLCILRDMYEKGELPKCQIFLDSPMATKATNLYKKYAAELVQPCQDNIQENGTVFKFDALTFTQTPQESKNINDIKTRAIIIAGSGMCNGGRITHHFKNRIWEKNNTVIFVGYQAVNTLGREIVEGAEWINLFGEDIIVKAKIRTINGFSAHADKEGILKWIKKIKGLKKVFLIHGEKEAQIAFKEELKEKLQLDAHIVSFKEKITLS